MIWLTKRYIFVSFENSRVSEKIKVIDAERGQALANEYGIKFVETSAKNSINVEEAFITLAKAIKERLIDPRPGGEAAAPPVDKGNGGIIVVDAVDSQGGQKKPAQSSGGCCA